MTIRPGNAALGLWQNHRTRRVANIVRIVRRDGTVYRFSDHDRALTIEGATYSPVIFAGMSSETREVGMRTPGQQMFGIIDGTTVVLPDLMGHRYEGAEVFHAEVDWQWPWLVIARNYKTIRSVRWDGMRFVASLDGIAQIIERPAGGRFGGIATRTCGYTLGDANTCKADISADVQTGARVATVNDDRLDVDISAASWSGSFSDDYFRDGEIEWLWGPPNFNGTTSATTTSTTLTQTGAGLTVDAHIGETVRILDAVGGVVQAYATVTDNDADSITYATQADMSGYASSTNWDVVPDAANKGVVSPIVGYTESTRGLVLFVPTPFAIEQYDSGIVRPGCDGLFSTCKNKFSNQDNFGANHLQPKPNDLLEVAP